MSDWSAKNPYMTEITENYILNGEGSRKETRHIVFALGDSGLDYKVGDALGVMSENPPHIVEEILELQGWDRDYLSKLTTVSATSTLLKEGFRGPHGEQEIRSIPCQQSRLFRNENFLENRRTYPKRRRVVF